MTETKGGITVTGDSVCQKPQRNNIFLKLPLSFNKLELIGNFGNCCLNGVMEI